MYVYTKKNWLLPFFSSFFQLEVVIYLRAVCFCFSFLIKWIRVKKLDRRANVYVNKCFEIHGRSAFFLNFVSFWCGFSLNADCTKQSHFICRLNMSALCALYVIEFWIFQLFFSGFFYEDFTLTMMYLLVMMLDMNFENL